MFITQKKLIVDSSYINPIYEALKTVAYTSLTIDSDINIFDANNSIDITIEITFIPMSISSDVIAKIKFIKSFDFLVTPLINDDLIAIIKSLRETATEIDSYLQKSYPLEMIRILSALIPEHEIENTAKDISSELTEQGFY